MSLSICTCCFCLGLLYTSLSCFPVPSKLAGHHSEGENARELGVTPSPAACSRGWWTNARDITMTSLMMGDDAGAPFLASRVDLSIGAAARVPPSVTCPVLSRFMAGLTHIPFAWCMWLMTYRALVMCSLLLHGGSVCKAEGDWFSCCLSPF